MIKIKKLKFFWEENIFLGQCGSHLSIFPSLEAQVASLSDDIAYCAHDIADGHEAGILSYFNLKSSPFFGEFLDPKQRFEDASSLSVAQGCRDLISYLVDDLICHSNKNIECVQENGSDGTVRNPIKFSTETVKKWWN